MENERTAWFKMQNEFITLCIIKIMDSLRQSSACIDTRCLCLAHWTSNLGTKISTREHRAAWSSPGKSFLSCPCEFNYRSWVKSQRGIPLCVISHTSGPDESFEVQVIKAMPALRNFKSIAPSLKKPFPNGTEINQKWESICSVPYFM